VVAEGLSSLHRMAVASRLNHTVLKFAPNIQAGWKRLHAVDVENAAW
jgi:hypothetical protein